MTAAGIPVVTAALEFLESTHTYVLDGQIIPSTTQVLDDNRLRLDYAHVPGDVLARARWRGLAAHAATHFDDEGTLDPRSVPDGIGSYLEAWRAFRADRHIEVVELERRYGHPVFRFGGQIDRIIRAPGRRGPIVLDLKCGDQTGVAYQLASYAELYRYAQGLAIAPDRWSVQLHPDRRAPYTVTEYRDPRHWRIFRAALDLTVARAAMGHSWRKAVAA